jgi:uncharacterized protein with HEPN domain
MINDFFASLVSFMFRWMRKDRQHGDFQVDCDIVWKTIQAALPVL